MIDELKITSKKLVGQAMERVETVDRGMLEFWSDPSSKFYQPIFSSQKKLLLFCGSDARSALATDTLNKMGVPNVCHLAGGLKGWKNAGLPLILKAKDKLTH